MSRIVAAFERPAVTRLVGSGIVALWACSVGVRFGTHDQATYLLRGMRLADPTLLARDWLVTTATDYHPFFTRLVAWPLFSFGWPPASVGFAALATLVAAGLAVRGMALRLRPERPLLALALTLSLLSMFGNAHSVGGSHLFYRALVPAALGAAGLLWSLYFFAGGRYLGSGLCVAVGGMFHANVLVLAFPFFAVAHLLLGTKGLAARLSRQIGPGLAVLGLFVPYILPMIGSSEAAPARAIFMGIRSPEHYVPERFLPDFVAYFGWAALALLAGRETLGGRPDWPAWRALLVSFAALMALGFLSTAVVYVPWIAQLYVWRLAPAGTVTAILVFAAAVLAPQEEARRPGQTVLGLALGAGLVASQSMGGAVWVGALSALALVVRSPWERLRRVGSFGLLVLPVLLLVAERGPALASEARELRRLSRWPGEEDPFYRWVATTPKDSLFLTPPGLSEFRLFGRRAIVVDWKSAPVMPTEVLEWYRRIRLVSGGVDVRGPGDARRGYEKLWDAGLARLQQEFGIDYAVFPPSARLGRGDASRVAYRDARFVVLRLP